jgi:hypothetical protein
MERCDGACPGRRLAGRGTVASEARRVAPDGGGWLVQGQEPMVLGGGIADVFSREELDYINIEIRLSCQGTVLETAEHSAERKAQRRKGEVQKD